MSIFNTKPLPRDKVIDFMNTYLDDDLKDQWFIAGGSVVNPRLAHDVDIFFTSEESYKQIYDILIQKLKFRSVNVSQNAVTGFLYSSTLTDARYMDEPIQFVTRHFGSPLEIMQHFDIPFCRQSILSNKQTIVHPTWQDTISVDMDNLKAGTLSRVHKYVIEYSKPLDVQSYKHCLTYMADNLDTPTEDFYGPTKKVYTYANLLQPIINNAKYNFSGSKFESYYNTIKSLEETHPELLV